MFCGTVVNHFYRAAHYVHCAVLLHMSSVRLSVTLMYRKVSSKVITELISLGSRSSVPQHRQSSPGEHPQNSGGIGWGRRSQQKTCNISETGQDVTKVTIDD